MSLYVGNLHSECNDAVLYKKFSTIGHLVSVKVCRDSETSKSLGYAYVNFREEEDAKKAIESMNYDVLYGQAIRIMSANKKPSAFPKAANIVVKNLDPYTNEFNLKEIFSPFGEIVSIKVPKTFRGDSKGIGFVQFAEEEAANEAIASVNGTEIQGRKVSVSKYVYFN